MRARLGLGLVLVFPLLMTGRQATAAELLAAVAANFSGTMERIAAKFSEKTGYKVLTSYGATGKFYTQIKNGAPFDVFLAADDKDPKLLEQEGFAVPGSRFTYAVGKLVLWSPRSRYVDGHGNILRYGGFDHLAIANPKTAPYGAAAQAVMQNLGVWEDLQPRLVIGENIGQAYQFVATHNAELGFVALSQVKETESGKQGSYWPVPQRLYRPLVQQAVLLQHGKDNAAAQALLEFLRGTEARAIIQELGYTLE